MRSEIVNVFIQRWTVNHPAGTLGLVTWPERVWIDRQAGESQGDYEERVMSMAPVTGGCRVLLECPSD